MMCINIHSEKIIGSQLNFIDKTFKKCAFLNVLSVFDFILPNFGDSFQEEDGDLTPDNISNSK